MLKNFIAILALANLASTEAKRFTPLEIDNHPCAPENLRTTNRYICDMKGNVICQPGWKEPQIETELNYLNPCLEPVCRGGCKHGKCKAPDFCTCDVGWEGPNCDVCVPLPGCMHGLCDEAFECKCIAGWEGAFCTIPECKNCSNGYCNTPNDCTCNNGWSGLSCDECAPLPGCVHGGCGDEPNTCVCDEKWQGHFCDQPACFPPCLNGVCMEGRNGSDNYCLCKSGWKGDACEHCSPYWMCPNQDSKACTQPNECLCFNGEPDPNKLCNNSDLIKAGMNSYPGIFFPIPIYAPNATQG